jgi:hypothetical protein
MPAICAVQRKRGLVSVKSGLLENLRKLIAEFENFKKSSLVHISQPKHIQQFISGQMYFW